MRCECEDANEENTLSMLFIYMLHTSQYLKMYNQAIQRKHVYPAKILDKMVWFHDFRVVLGKQLNCSSVHSSYL